MGYDKKLSTLHLKEYLNKTSTVAKNNNVLTRSILCKMHGELNTKDVNNAKKFLQEKAYFGDIKDYSDIIEQLRHQFHWKSSTSISSGMVCMDKKLKKCFEEEARVLQYHR